VRRHCSPEQRKAELEAPRQDALMAQLREDIQTEVTATFPLSCPRAGAYRGDAAGHGCLLRRTPGLSLSG